MKENQISEIVLDAAICVHRAFGPGLLESVYQKALCIELLERGLKVKSEFPVEVSYKGSALGLGFRGDILVESLVLLELKSVEDLSAAHRKQVLTYLRVLNLRLGLLINFGAPLLKTGYERIVNNL